jgi:hypothetical protein
MRQLMSDKQWKLFIEMDQYIQKSPISFISHSLFAANQSIFYMHTI